MERPLHAPGRPAPARGDERLGRRRARAESRPRDARACRGRGRRSPGRHDRAPCSPPAGDDRAGRPRRRPSRPPARRSRPRHRALRRRRPRLRPHRSARGARARRDRARPLRRLLDGLVHRRDGGRRLEAGGDPRPLSRGARPPLAVQRLHPAAGRADPVSQGRSHARAALRRAGDRGARETALHGQRRPALEPARRPPPGQPPRGRWREHVDSGPRAAAPTRWPAAGRRRRAEQPARRRDGRDGRRPDRRRRRRAAPRSGGRDGGAAVTVDHGDALACHGPGQRRAGRGEPRARARRPDAGGARRPLRDFRSLDRAIEAGRVATRAALDAGARATILDALDAPVA